MTEISFTRKGYIEVWRGDTFISRHTVETEAVESIFADAEINGLDTFEYEIRYPSKEVRGKGRVKKIVGYISGEAILE